MLQIRDRIGYFSNGKVGQFFTCYVLYVATLYGFSMFPKSTRFAIPDLTADNNPYTVQTCFELMRDYARCMLSFKKMLKRSVRIVIACSLTCTLECLAVGEYTSFGVLTMGSFTPLYGIVAIVPKWLRVLSAKALIGASLRSVRSVRPDPPIDLKRFLTRPTEPETKRQIRGKNTPNFSKGIGKELGEHILQRINNTEAHVHIFRLLHESVRDLQRATLWPKDARIILKGSTSLAIRCHAVMPAFLATLVCSVWKVFSGGDLDIQLHFHADMRLADQRDLSKALLYRIASNYNESFGKLYMRLVQERLDKAYNKAHPVVHTGVSSPNYFFYIKELKKLMDDGCSQKVQTSVEVAPPVDGMLLTRNTIKWTYSPYAAWWKRLFIPRILFHLDRAWATFAIKSADGDIYLVVAEHIDVALSSINPRTISLVVCSRNPRTHTNTIVMLKTLMCQWLRHFLKTTLFMNHAHIRRGFTNGWLLFKTC
jgi:hypothetical protein